MERAGGKVKLSSKAYPSYISQAVYLCISSDLGENLHAVVVNKKLMFHFVVRLFEVRAFPFSHRSVVRRSMYVKIDWQV